MNKFLVLLSSKKFEVKDKWLSDTRKLKILQKRGYNNVETRSASQGTMEFRTCRVPGHSGVGYVSRVKDMR